MAAVRSQRDDNMQFSALHYLLLKQFELKCQRIVLMRPELCLILMYLVTLKKLFYYIIYFIENLLNTSASFILCPHHALFLCSHPRLTLPWETGSLGFPVDSECSTLPGNPIMWKPGCVFL